ncbi:MAG TPA: PAS domain-containing protein [Candidatus Limnocylindria bacterium]|nr:PAS domain-containing protein [Candidatus Limnocylindria bacterium]
MSGRAWRAAVVVAAAVGLVELAGRAGAGLPDLMPLYLLAVVYAALDGGLWPGLAGGVVVFAHALFTAGGGTPGLYALAIAAPATVAVATLLALPPRPGDALQAPVEAEAGNAEPAGSDGDTVRIEREPGALAFTALSANAERVLGIPVEQALASAELWTSGLHPGDRARVQTAYDTLARAPAECTLTYRVISAEAGFITVRETLRPHRAQPGGPVLALVGAITRLPETDAEAPAPEIPAPAASTEATAPAAPGDEVLARVAAALEPLRRGARPRPRRVDMALVMHAALEHTRPAAQARGIAVAWSLDPALDLRHGDAERVEQIVRAMLGNAIDLAPDGARIHAALEQAGSLARLTLSDTADTHGATFSVTLPVTPADM